MSTTAFAAYEEISAKVLAAVRAHEGLCNTTNMSVVFEGRDDGVVRPASRYFVEVVQIVNTSGLAAFGHADRLYTTTGQLYMKVYAPQVLANAYECGHKFAFALRDSFRGPAIGVNRVWYRRETVVTLPAEKAAHRFNVIVDFTFDERK